MRWAVLVAVLAVSGCGQRAGAPDAALADAEAGTQAGRVEPTRWSLSRDDTGKICAGAGGQRPRCFEPAEVLAGRRGDLGRRALSAPSPYALSSEGVVSVAAPEPPKEDERDKAPDPEVVARNKEEAFRRLIVAKLPPIAKLAYEPMSSCALTKTGDVLCWPEPSFAQELPRVVPLSEPATELFLQSWMTLCVRTASRRVLCSKGHPLPLDVCADSKTNARSCGPAVAAFAPPRLGQRLGSVRALASTLTPRELIPIAEDVDELRPFAHQTHYEHLDGHLYIGDTQPGGCTVTPSPPPVSGLRCTRKGSDLRCFRRAGCVAGRPWELAKIEGFTGDVRKLHLGAERGYVLTGDGSLFAFDRGAAGEPADGSCKAEDNHRQAGSASPTSIAAVRVSLRSPVFDVAGGVVSMMALPGYTSVDCASLVDGSVWCWRSGDRELGAPHAIDFEALLDAGAYTHDER